MHDVSTGSSLPLVCWCHQNILTTDVCGQTSVHENWKHWILNTDYQSAITEQRSVQGSTDVKQQQCEIWMAEVQERRAGHKHFRIILVEQGWKSRTLKTGEDTKSHTGQFHLDTSAGDKDSCWTMDILETHAFDRRQRRNMVPTHFSLYSLLYSNSNYQSFTTLTFDIFWANFFKINVCSQLLMTFFFLSLSSCLSVLWPAFGSPALLFVHSLVLLPVDSRLAGIHLFRRCQISTSAPIGCSSAELESRSEFPGCGGRPGFLCCWRLVLDMARAFSAWYVPCLCTQNTHIHTLTLTMYLRPHA